MHGCRGWNHQIVPIDRESRLGPHRAQLSNAAVYNGEMGTTLILLMGPITCCRKINWAQGKREKDRKTFWTVTTFPNLYVNIWNKCSGKWSFQDNSMSFHNKDVILQQRKGMIQLVKNKEYRRVYTYVPYVKNEERVRQIWGLLSKVYAPTIRCWLSYYTTKEVSITEVVHV